MTQSGSLPSASLLTLFFREAGIDVRELEGTSKVQRNGIYYFEAWKALSFVYKDMNIAPYRVVPLGAFEDDICDTMENAKGELAVRLELET